MKLIKITKFDNDYHCQISETILSEDEYENRKEEFKSWSGYTYIIKYLGERSEE
jgi:hypothetical protein